MTTTVLTTRARLIATTNEMLANQPQTSLTLEDVAAQAGLPLAVAAQDVGQMDDLMRLVAFEHLYALHGKINDQLVASPPQTWEDVLQLMMERTMEYGLANPCVVSLFLGYDGWRSVGNLTLDTEDEQAAQMTLMLPPHLWESIAHHEGGLNPFRLAIDMIISVLQAGYAERGALEFDIMVEAKRVARAYLSAIQNERR